jgi:hypothetical protein
MKILRLLALAGMLTMVFPLASLASDNGAREQKKNVNLAEQVVLAGKTLAPGQYKLEWQGNQCHPERSMTICLQSDMRSRRTPALSNALILPQGILMKTCSELPGTADTVQARQGSFGSGVRPRLRMTGENNLIAAATQRTTMFTSLAGTMITFATCLPAIKA